MMAGRQTDGWMDTLMLCVCACTYVWAHRELRGERRPTDAQQTPLRWIYYLFIINTQPGSQEQTLKDRRALYQSSGIFMASFQRCSLKSLNELHSCHIYLKLPHGDKTDQFIKDGSRFDFTPPDSSHCDVTNLDSAITSLVKKRYACEKISNCDQKKKENACQSLEKTFNKIPSHNVKVFKAEAVTLIALKINGPASVILHTFCACLGLDIIHL